MLLRASLCKQKKQRSLFEITETHLFRKCLIPNTRANRGHGLPEQLLAIRAEDANLFDQSRGRWRSAEASLANTREESSLDNHFVAAADIHCEHAHFSQRDRQTDRGSDGRCVGCIANVVRKCVCALARRRQLTQHDNFQFIAHL